jgi:hypothetical protein
MNRRAGDSPERRYNPAVLRMPLIAVSATLALAAGTAFASSEPQASSAPAARAATSVQVWVKTRGGPWRKSLSLKLRKAKLSVFYVCATYKQSLAAGARCESSVHIDEPGALLKIEQSPVKKAQKRPESPGWGLVAAGDHKVVQAELSNLVTGDNFGTFKYRAALRSLEGRPIATSRVVRVTWHR